MRGILHTRTHIYIHMCGQKRLTQRQDILNFDCHRNASVLLVALLLTRFFCKCNAKNCDTHNVSLHTVEECRGSRLSLISSRVLAVSVFVEEAYEWSVSHQPRVMNSRTKARERFHFSHEPPLLGPNSAYLAAEFEVVNKSNAGDYGQFIAHGFDQSGWL